MTTEHSESDGHSAPSRLPRERLARFAERMRKEAERAKSGFTIHGVTFAAVNSLLLLINLVFSPGYLWFLFPAASWGIGLLHHYVEVRNRWQDARDAVVLPAIDKRRLDQVRKLFSIRRGLRHHLSAVAGVSAFLAGINLLVDPDNGPWAIVPAWCLGVSLAIHYGSVRTGRRRLLRGLREAGVDLDRRKATNFAALEPDARIALTPSDARLLSEAAELRETILAELRDGSKETARWRSELQPELDTYIRHIGSLLQTRCDLERAGARVSEEEVTQRLATLRGKLRNAASDDLGREYRTAMHQYERQLQSLANLHEQAEMIDLRVKSAVLTLQQLSFDIPRLRTAPTGESATLLALRDKSRDLTHYLDDLRAGFRETESAADPACQ